MKAVICPKSGPPELLLVKELPKPQPKANEVLIRVVASSVTMGDVNLRRIPRWILTPIGLLFGFKAMEISGVEYSGIIEDLGMNVKDFQIGDEVFGTATGLKYGGNAEFICVPDKMKKGVIGHKPKMLSFEEAATMPVGAMTAMHLLRKAFIKPGSKVLIYGASGSVGTYAVQLAKLKGAEVTGVSSKGNFELIKSIGAEHTIDYHSEDFTSGKIIYDIIFDAVGKITKHGCRKVLSDGGQFLSVKYPTSEKKEYLYEIIELAESGLLKSVIDRSYHLDEIVEAHVYVESGRKKGNVSILINNK